MLRPEFTGQFKRDYKLAVKRGFDPKKLETVIGLLCEEAALPEAYRDHPLANSKNYVGMRECHIQPDWLPDFAPDPDRYAQRPILTYDFLRAGCYPPVSVCAAEGAFQVAKLADTAGLGADDVV